MVRLCGKIFSLETQSGSFKDKSTHAHIFPQASYRLPSRRTLSYIFLSVTPPVCASLITVLALKHQAEMVGDEAVHRLVWVHCVCACACMVNTNIHADGKSCSGLQEGDNLDKQREMSHLEKKIEHGKHRDREMRLFHRIRTCHSEYTHVRGCILMSVSCIDFETAGLTIRF